MATEILTACFILSVLVNILLITRVAVLRNNLKLFGDKLHEIEQHLTPKHLKEGINEQKNVQP